MKSRILAPLLCMFLGVFCPGSLLLAQQVLTGKVVSATDTLPLPGAFVHAEGENSGARTDREGRFRLSVEKGDTITIVVSHLGYKSYKVRVTMPEYQPLLIVLEEDVALLDEVVVSTGYEMLPRERATGSFEHIDTDLFNRQGSTDVISRLDGIAPSVLFDKRSGSNMGFKIRGLSTISTQIAQPLIIVDNFPYEGDIRNINPNDVESITLLKDAAASSIWGVRAGNGVLVITTKKSSFNQPFKLTLTSDISVQERPDLFYRPQISPADFIEIERFLFDQGAFDTDLSNDRTWPVITPAVEIMDRMRTGKISVEEGEKLLNELGQRDIRKDLRKYFFRRPFKQQYSLNLQGGGSKLNYLLSAGFDKNLESSVGNEYERLTLRANNSFKPLKGLELQTRISYALSRRQNNNPGELTTGRSGTLYPYARLVDENGNPAILEQDYRLSYVDTAGGGRLLDWHYRPLEEIELADNTTSIENLVLGISAKYQLFEPLSVEIKYQYQNQVNRGRDYRSDKMYYTRDLINRFTQIDGEETIRPVPIGGILRQAHGSTKAHNFRTQLNFDHSWAEKHEVSALAGAEIREITGTSSSSITYGYDDYLLISQTVDLVNRFPIYDGLSFFPSSISGGSAFGGRLNRDVSAYANASYIYDRRYIFSMSARRDASNLFGVETNNKWKPLWSAGASWNLSNENFYHSKLFPYIKLRATYGHSGNVNNSIAAVTTIRYGTESRLGRFPYATIQNAPNPNLRWENVATFNAGVDFSMGNRIRGSLEYYIKKCTDLISSVSADITTGFSALDINSAILNTKGVDFSLSSTNINRAFTWESTAWFSYNRSKVAKYLYEPSDYAIYVGNRNLSPLEGRNAYNVISYKWGGLDPQTGDPRGYLDDKLSTDYAALTRGLELEDLVFHGPALPLYFGALRNTFSWKGISLSANITARFAYFFRRPTVSYSELFNGVATHGDYYLRWQQPGDERHTTVPSMVYPGDSRRDKFYFDSEPTVEKGDHIRLQDISMGYQFPSSILTGLSLKALQVSVYANNLGIIWRSNKHGLDPDFAGLPASPGFFLKLRATL